MIDAEINILLERWDLTGVEMQRKIVARFAEDRIVLLQACQYAAGSFAQVASDKSVPPIVLHDCKDKLDEAIAFANRKTKRAD